MPIRISALAALVAVAALSIGADAATAAPNSWTQLNLTGGDVAALALDPSNSSVLYAGTFKGGVFKSTDGGQTWAAENNGLATQGYLKIYSLAIDPTATSTIYAGTAFGHVFESTNGGGSWSEISTGLPGHDIEALAVDPSTPSTLYAAPYDGGVFKSTDSGAHWNAVNTGISGSALFVYSLAIDPTATGTIYAATGSGIYKTADGGTSGWSPSSTGPPLPNNPDVVRIDPASHTTLYTGTVGGGVYKSTDSGANWSAINNGIGAPTPLFSDLNVRSLAGAGQTWYAGTFDGVYVSSDGGATWTAATAPGPSGLALAVDPASASTVFLGTGTQGMFKSTDSGGTWTQINSGFTNVDVQGVAVDPTNYLNLFAATPHGVFGSSDGGMNWGDSGSGLPFSINGGTLAVLPSTPETLFVGTPSKGLYTSTDGGQSWVNVAAAAGTNGNVTAVATSPSGKTVLASSNGSEVDVSSDGGATFTSFTNDGAGHQFADNGNVATMAVDTDGSALAVAWSDGTSRVLTVGSWFNLTRAGLPATFSVRAIAWKTDLGVRTVVIATDAGVFFYDFTGDKWNPVNLALPAATTTIVDPAGSLYAGTDGAGVWENDDPFGTGTWFQLNSGLTNPFVSSLSHVPNSSLVYVGSPGGGVYAIGSPPAPATLTVTKTGTGSGTVTSAPAGVSCGSTCSHAFGSGTSVTLTATPAAGSTFAGWSGACSGTGTCTLTMDSDKAATATFTLVPKTLTVTKGGTGTGGVTSSPAGIDCGSTCAYAFADGTQVTLSATASSGSTFAGWSGACTGTGTCQVTMSADRAVTATFTANPPPPVVHCVVPNVKGKQLAAARSAITHKHCSVGKVKMSRSKKKKGTVLSQSPPPGKVLAEGAKVSLVVSKGKR